MSMNLPAQFIVVRLVPQPSGKTDKIPLDRHGNVTDPHIPDVWLDEANARQFAAFQDQAGIYRHTIGFVLTDADPYVFLDFDNCYTGNGWTPAAHEYATAFASAAQELSSSRTGFHVLGRVPDQSALRMRRNRWDGWKEFYHRKRFVAFGFEPWQGDPNADITEAVSRLVPVRATDTDAELIDGPSPDWTGPENDDELIRRMCTSAPSIDAAFGAKAHPNDLWTRNVAVLAAVYPADTPGKEFDYSKADASLMGHLAFWTGRDAARMDRLFRRSALVREKYLKRADYRNETITGAARACKTVFNKPRVQTTPAGEQTAQHPAHGKKFGEILTIQDQQEYFAGCVYVRDAHRVMIPGGKLLRPEQFKTYYGGHQFLMTATGENPSKNAFEAFTENRAFHFPKAEAMCFRPELPPGSVVDGKVNCYFPIEQRFTPGDVGPFMDLLQRLLPDERDRAIIIAVAAFIVQNPGKLVKWAPVLVGTQGNGKTTVMECIAHAVGEKYSHYPSAEDLANPFNSYLQHKLFIGVEEIHMDGRREVLDTLKPLITNKRIEVQPKGVDKYMVDHCANFWFNTNHEDAIIKTKEDRRYAVFFCAQRRFEDLARDGLDGDYFPRLIRWLDTGGRDHVAYFLHTYAVPAALSPETTLYRAPDTSTTSLAIRASLGRAEQEITECIESETPGFRGGWLSSGKVTDLMRDRGLKLSPQRVRKTLEGLGYMEVERASRVLMEEAGGRPVLYVRRDLYAAGMGTDAYCMAQGYQRDAPVSLVDLPGVTVPAGLRLVK